MAQKSSAIVIILLLTAGAVTAQTTRPFSDREAALIDTAQNGADQQARVSALRQIGMSGDDRFLDALTEVLSDPAIEWRLVAVKAIADVGTRRSAGKLKEVASDQAQNIAVRVTACDKLVSLAQRQPKDENLKSLLTELSRSPEPKIGKAAAAGLAKAVEPPKAATPKPHPEVPTIKREGFSDIDISLLEGLRIEAAAPLETQVQQETRLFAKFEHLPPTNPVRQSRLEELDAAKAKLHDLKAMSPAEWGAAIQEDADALDSIAKSAHEAAPKVAGVVTDMLHETSTYTTKRGETKTQDNIVSATMFGALFGAVSEERAYKASQKAGELKDLLNNLTPTAKKAIAAQYAENLRKKEELEKAKKKHDEEMASARQARKEANAARAAAGKPTIFEPDDLIGMTLDEAKAALHITNSRVHTDYANDGAYTLDAFPYSSRRVGRQYETSFKSYWVRTHDGVITTYTESDATDKTGN